MMMDSCRGTGFGLVDVRSGDWVPAPGRTTNSVIEEENTLSTRNIFQKDLFNLRVVISLDRFIRGKVFFGGWRCGQGTKGMLIDIERCFLASDVFNSDRKICISEVSLRLAFWW